MSESNSLNISMLQYAMAWENTDKNLLKLDKILSDNASGIGELIVLPEMFNTGFSMNPSLFGEKEAEKALHWMQYWCDGHKKSMMGSMICKENGYYYNRLYWVSPNQKPQQYDKKHLFRFAGEHQHYSAGNQKLIVSYKGFKLCPLICYDLRFPVFSRNKWSHGHMDYDCLIYIANWPKARRKAWMNLLEARAHENLAYCIGVNRTGIDGNGIVYSGDSMAFDFKGNKIGKLDKKTGIETISINLLELQKYREKFPAAMDADHFEITG